MTDLRQNSMTGEQWVLEERSADPASTEEGERWLRTDLNSGDKIATLRVDVGSSIRDVPIFATGTAVDTVSEAMRIQVNGMTGYVPIAPVSDAAFPELRMQHNSQVHGFHDRVEPGPAIPDSAIHRQKIDEGSGTTLADNIGSIDATTSGGPVWIADSSAQGGQKLDFDATDDLAEFDSNNQISLASDFSAAITLERDSGLESKRYVWEWSDGNESIALAGGESTSGVICATYFDGSTRASVASVSEPTTPYRIRAVVTWDASASDIGLFIDTAEATGTTSGAVNAGAATHVLNANVSLIGEGGSILDDWIVYDGLLGSTGLQTDYDAQPWT